jgi:hypothetical protein
MMASDEIILEKSQKRFYEELIKKKIVLFT